MPDEAVTNYQDLIDNLELGISFLNKEFGECAKIKVAWQIDSFGHSKTVMNLYKMAGIDTFFMGRMDYEVFDKFKNESNMEFIWRDEETGREMFSVITPDLYIAPFTFCWDSWCDSWSGVRGDAFIQDDERLEGYNVESRVKGCF